MSLAKYMDLHPASIAGRCAGCRLGHTVVCFESVGSTNTAASLVAAAGAPEGTIVLASRQTSGRGRKGRHWVSDASGSLVFSIVLRPEGRYENLTSVLALAALGPIDGIVGGAAIKWPNDIWISGRKVAGILAESKNGCVVIGMGINVNNEKGSFPDDLAGTAASLRMLAGRTLDRGGLLAGIVRSFGDAYGRWEREGFAGMRAGMEERLLWKGLRVAVETGEGTVHGVLGGISAEGFLRVEASEGEILLAAGDVSLAVIPPGAKGSG